MKSVHEVTLAILAHIERGHSKPRTTYRVTSYLQPTGTVYTDNIPAAGWLLEVSEDCYYPPVRQVSPIDEKHIEAYWFLRLFMSVNHVLFENENSRHPGYHKDTSYIHVPDGDRYADDAEYLAVVAHEVVHFAQGKFGLTTPDYPVNEVVVDIGAYMLLHFLGVYNEIPTKMLDYISSWHLTHLHNHPHTDLENWLCLYRSASLAEEIVEKIIDDCTLGA